MSDTAAGGVPAVSGDPNHDFARFVVPELDVLLRVAMTMTAQPADAEDLVQDTLLRAYRSIGTFDGAHPRAWLLTIMRNAQVNRTRRRRPVLLENPDTALDHPADPAGNPEQALLDAAFDTAVDQALRALPVRHRQVVYLVDVAGLSYAETATALGIPAGTVMSRLHRARARIRAHLKAAGVASRKEARP